LTIAELIQEQRRRLGSGNRVERFAAAMLIPAVLSKRLAGLPIPAKAEVLSSKNLFGVCSNRLF
jgi:hypothetical protein